MMLDNTAKGVFVIAPTPFTDQGAVDLDSAARMTDAFLEAGATGITLLGVMGEAPKLDAREALEVTTLVLRRVDGRIPVVVGVSAPGLAAMRALSEGAMAAGAAGVMIAPTPGLRGDDAVLAYLRQASAAVGSAPWVLQDYPQLTGVHLSAGMVATLAAEDPRLVMLKAEDHPGLDKLSAIRALIGNRLSIMGGNGGIFLPHEIERGADGIMTGYAFPEMLDRVYALSRDGEHEAAHDLFDLHLPLIRYELQPGLGLAVRKHVLARRGWIASAALRTPGPKLTPTTIAEIEFILARLGARDPASRL